jgi:ABC-type polysaccharide/polyol phosphate export permease
MRAQLAELYHFRGLLWAIVRRDIKVRYKQSVMGILWAILMPMVIVGAGALVRYSMAIFADKPFQAYEIVGVMVKALPWAFFVSSVKFATVSLISNPNLVTKIRFPKEIFPVAAILSSAFDLAVASVVVVVVCVLIQLPVTWDMLWLPVILISLISFCMGLGLMLSALNLFFRDVKYIVEVILTFGIFFSPVFYEVSMFGMWKGYLMLNPVAPLLEAVNATVVLGRSPELGWLAYSALISGGTLLLGYLFFKSQEERFAEYI